MIIQYKIVRKIGELPQIGKGYVKQLNLVEWDGHAAKYDRAPGPAAESLPKVLLFRWKNL